VQQPFDPYHKWLGILPQDQPPHHYRLLGLVVFESDPDAIDNAADARIAQLRMFQQGPYSVEAQVLLNQVASARLCLLDPARKGMYDRQLRQQLAQQMSHSPPPLTYHSPFAEGVASTYPVLGGPAYPMPGGSPYPMPDGSAIGMPGGLAYPMPDGSAIGMPGSSAYPMPGNSGIGMPGMSGGYGDYGGIPQAVPVAAPTAMPVGAPTAIPVAAPAAIPAGTPTAVPVATPTAAPVAASTAAPVGELVTTSSSHRSTAATYRRRAQSSMGQTMTLGLVLAVLLGLGAAALCVFGGSNPFRSNPLEKPRTIHYYR
jgi:hypothetical protein